MGKRCFTYCGDRCDCGAGDSVLGKDAWAAILSANPGLAYDKPTPEEMARPRFFPSRIRRPTA